MSTYVLVCVNVQFRISHGSHGPFGNRGLIFVALGSAEKNHNKKCALSVDGS